jgi:hypothetical protein
VFAVRLAIGISRAEADHDFDYAGEKSGNVSGSLGDVSEGSKFQDFDLYEIGRYVQEGSPLARDLASYEGPSGACGYPCLLSRISHRSSPKNGPRPVLSRQPRNRSSRRSHNRVSQKWRIILETDFIADQCN